MTRLTSPLASLQTNKHKQSHTAHMGIGMSLSGLGYVLLHHRPIRGLESQSMWSSIEPHSKSLQSFWVQPCKTFNKPQQHRDIVIDPVEMCWQATASCNHQSYQTAGAMTRDDISIHQSDGSHTAKGALDVAKRWQLDESQCLQSPVSILLNMSRGMNYKYMGGTPDLSDGCRRFKQHIDFQWASELLTNCSMFYPTHINKTPWFLKQGDCRKSGTRVS